MKSMTLPGSGVQINIQEGFDKDSVSSFVSRIMTEDGVLEKYKADPQGALAQLGVDIRLEDIAKIKPDDLGVLQRPDNVGPQAWAAAAVAVAVFCYPSKTDPKIGKPGGGGIGGAKGGS